MFDFSDTLRPGMVLRAIPIVETMTNIIEGNLGNYESFEKTYLKLVICPPEQPARELKSRDKLQVVGEE